MPLWKEHFSILKTELKSVKAMQFKHCLENLKVQHHT